MELGQPEVEDLQAILMDHEQVLGLDVTVDDSLRVRRVEAIRDLNRQIQQALSFQSLSADHLPERLPFQQLHGDERLTIEVVDFVDRADVRVV